MFEGRKLLIVTKHRKENAIAPILEDALGVEVFVEENFDTDQLGTFTGEVERNQDPISTAKRKCREGMHHSGFDLAIASEGSFGPHPTLFFVPIDEEIVVLVDHKNNLELVAKELSTETNFDSREVGTVEELLEFASQVMFPTHALILRPTKDNFQGMVKGIHEESLLIKVFSELKERHPSVYVETDMRAMHNPSRMKVIAKATEKLLALIQSKCPNCQSPGFAVSDYIRGLPCSQCGSPTRSVLAEIFTCQICHHQLESPNQQNKESEDPMYCDFCNP